MGTHVSRLICYGGLAGVDTDLGWPILAVSLVWAISGESLSRAVLERMTDAQFRL